MFCKTNSGQLVGIDGQMIQVEVDVSDGLPSFDMVGYLAADVREAKERVQTALRNSGISLRPKRVMVNFSPANERKEGSCFDMAVAVAVLVAYAVLQEGSFLEAAFFGELGLDGTIRSVKGILSLVLAAKRKGIARCFVPRANRREAAMVEGIEIVGIASLEELILILGGRKEAKITVREQERGETERSSAGELDFSEVKGEAVLRRAAEIAAAGQHNLLFIGPPGSGKTMIARRIPSILPLLSQEERLEVSKVYSVCGFLSEEKPFVYERPFRSPHHSVTLQAMTGGGAVPKPGELSLASKGVLFLDELAEFQRGTLEVLRQPLEEGKIHVARVQGAFVFPADMMLVAATNPCPCGYYPDRNQCICSTRQVKRYLGKISKPLLERIDISVEAKPLRYEEAFEQERGESSAQIRDRVEKARQRQRERFLGSAISVNGRMRAKDLKRYCQMDAAAERFLQRFFQEQSFNMRSYEKSLKIARTIADLQGEENIREEHIKEAVFYRRAASEYWGGGWL